MGLASFAKTLYSFVFDNRLHAYLLFFFFMLSGFEESFNSIGFPALVISLAFVSCLVFCVLFNKGADIQIPVDEKTAKEFVRKVYTLVFSLFFLLIPIKIVFHKPKIFALYGIMALMGFLYSQKLFKKPLKEIFLVKNISIALLWALPISFAAFLVNEEKFSLSLNNFFVGFFIMLVLSILYDVRDMEKDRSEKVRTIPNVFGISSTKKLLFGLLLTSSLLMVLFQFPIYSQIILVPLIFYVGFVDQKRPAFFFDSILLSILCFQMFIMYVD